MQGYDQGKAFLAGPGPMQSTAREFWTMIWEKKSYAIVMLGKLNENEEVINLITKRISVPKVIYFRRFVINTGQLKDRNVSLESSLLKQHQKMHGAKT